MKDVFNIYCDESCHLERDNARSMVLGALQCRADLARHAAEEIRSIKLSNGLSPRFEIKWTKVSPGNLSFYQDLIDYFFLHSTMRLRALVVPDKSIIDPNELCCSHDDVYYSMYFDMLKVVIKKSCAYNIYIDIKDTRGTSKVKRLHEVLCNNINDQNRETVRHAQQVRSHEVEQMQLADLLIGCISYANRALATSPAKVELVKQFHGHFKHDLRITTPRGASKVNILQWTPKGAGS